MKEKLRRYGQFYYGGRYEQLFGAKALRSLVLVGADYGIRPENRVEKLAALAQQLEVTFFRFAPLSTFLGASPREVLITKIWRRPGEPGLSSLF